MTEQQKIEALIGLLPRKRSRQYYSEQLDIDLDEVERLIRKIRTNKDDADLTIEGSNSFQYNLDKGTYEVDVYYSQPPTPEQLISDHKIDSLKWKLSSFYSKQKPKGWQTTALFKNVTPEQESIDNFQEFLKTWKSDYKPVKTSIINDKFNSPSCLVLSLCDFHLGKRDRVMVPLEQRLEQYKQTVENLLYKAYHSHNLEEIVFVLGNDLFQTDTVLGTTVKFTKVDESENWDDIYEVGFKLMVETITKLKSYCKNLKVILTPGNHSESKEYYLTHALEVYFKQDKTIDFDRSSDKYKCHVYGQTSLFFSHGDTINDKLPLAFAQTFYKQWGLTKYKEILLGDKHHNSEKRVGSHQGEAQGVRMRILPSLTNTDQWHYNNLFTNAVQAGIALVYDKEKGKCSEFEHRI